MEGIKNKVAEIWRKIKSIKHIEIILAIAAVALMIIIFSGFKTKSTVEEKPTTTTVSTGSETDIVTQWEKKLAAILSGIDGVGKAEVMITTKTTTEKITANTMSTSNTSSGNGSNSTTNVTTSPVIVTNNGVSEPYIIKEVMPEIMGVIVVAEGANNAITKLSIMRAIQTVLDVDSSRVEIYQMN